jgi:hypothetical protein
LTNESLLRGADARCRRGRLFAGAMSLEAIAVLANEFFRIRWPLTACVVAVLSAPLWWLVVFALVRGCPERGTRYWVGASCLGMPLLIVVLAWPVARAGLVHSSGELGEVVTGIQRYTAAHQGTPPESLGALVPAYVSSIPAGGAICRRPHYKMLPAHAGTYLYRLGPGELGFDVTRRAAFLEVCRRSRKSVESQS